MKRKRRLHLARSVEMVQQGEGGDEGNKSDSDTECEDD
jgi:hypothetical protein